MHAEGSIQDTPTTAPSCCLKTPHSQMTDPAHTNNAIQHQKAHNDDAPHPHHNDTTQEYHLTQSMTLHILTTPPPTRMCLQFPPGSCGKSQRSCSVGTCPPHSRTGPARKDKVCEHGLHTSTLNLGLNGSSVCALMLLPVTNFACIMLHPEFFFFFLHVWLPRATPLPRFSKWSSLW